MPVFSPLLLTSLRLHDYRQGQAPRQVEAWTMDEHRIGLKPIIRRVWAKRGQRPIVKVYPRYQWLYVYSFIQPVPVVASGC